MYENEGYGKLGKKTYEESIEEMKHADRIVKRVLLLDGLPNLQALNKLQIGTAVEERLNADLKAETTGRTAIVEESLDDTEEHIDFLETQLAVIAEIGVQNYLQSQYELDSASS
jgi:bacterioferritin